MANREIYSTIIHFAVEHGTFYTIQKLCLEEFTRFFDPDGVRALSPYAANLFFTQ